MSGNFGVSGISCVESGVCMAHGVIEKCGMYRNACDVCDAWGVCEVCGVCGAYGAYGVHTVHVVRGVKVGTHCHAGRGQAGFGFGSCGGFFATAFGFLAARLLLGGILRGFLGSHSGFHGSSFFGLLFAPDNYFPLFCGSLPFDPVSSCYFLWGKRLLCGVGETQTLQCF